MVGKDDDEESVGWRDLPRFTLVGDEDQDVWANCLDPAARPVWELWRTWQSRTKNEWAKPGENSQAWFHVLRVHSQWSGRRSVDAAAEQTFELDGTHITDEASFFCAIGEAVNGPGGYFGAGLDGLSDCLCGGFGAKVPFTLIWKNSSVARAHLGKSPEGPDREVRVRPSSRKF